MKIDRKGWVYKIAYGHCGWGHKPSSRVGLCALVKQFFWSLFVVWPLAIVFIVAVVIIFAALAICMYATLYGFGFFFAARPQAFDGPGYEICDFVSYKKWPKIRGFRIIPIWLLLLVALIANFSAVISEIKSYFVQLAEYTIYSKGFWMFFGFVAAIIVSAFIRSYIKNNEACQVLKEYLKARKQKFCPTIDVV
jgi:hypothetical protein